MFELNKPHEAKTEYHELISMVDTLMHPALTLD